MSTKPNEPGTPNERPNVVQFPATQNGEPKALPPQTEDEEPLSTRTLIGIGVFLLALVLSGVWLMNTLRDIGKMQDCAMQGRRNCAPIETPRER